MNRENAHLYLPLVQALKDGHTLQFSSYPANPDATWWDLDFVCFAQPPEHYRVKPATIRIGAFDVPEPLRVAPARGSEYYSPNLCRSDPYNDWTWANDCTDNRLLSQGLCHATKEAAELHARALISLTQTPAPQP